MPIEDKELPLISKETKYWIIRSGIESKYFDQFFTKGCIAVGWDRISNIDNIKELKDSSLLKNWVLQNYPELANGATARSLAKKVGDITSKIFRFVNELKIGDIIVTPGKDEILIGEITGNPYLKDGIWGLTPETPEEKLLGVLNKAREVSWLKRINKKQLEPNLRSVLGIYHGIAQIKIPQVITEINRSVYDFYIHEDEGHSIFKVKTEEAVNFEKYAYFINSLKIIYEMIKPTFENSNLYIKTNVQSPGPIEIIGNPQMVSQMVLAAKAILKNDNTALEKISEPIKDKIAEYMEENPPEYDYDDYGFPFSGTY